jgi:hypothetical protein
MGLQYGKYGFTCRFEKQAILPDFKGSTFHGVFGRALKNVVCALKQQTCDKCPLQNRCLYVRVFETQLIRKPEEQARYSDIPHPYVIEPPENAENSFEKDGEISCGLTLFGEFTRDLPYFIYAFDLMGKTGLGRRVGGSRGKFCLAEVRNGHKTIYKDKEKTIRQAGATRELTLTPATGDPIEKIAIMLETPLRVKHGQKLARDLPFHVLARAMIRRMTCLMAAYGDGEPDWDYPGLVKKAEAVKTAGSDLRWHDIERYSFRQKQRTPIGGLIGRVVYEQVPTEFLTLLQFCEKAHVGKNTTFGLGKISVVVPGS